MKNHKFTHIIDESINDGPINHDLADPQSNLKVTRSGVECAMNSVVPMPALAALTSSEFFTNIEKAFNIAHFDPWDGMLLGVTMSLSYFTTDYLKPDAPRYAKLVTSGVIGAIVLTVANGISPKSEGAGIWAIIIAFFVVTACLLGKEIQKFRRRKRHDEGSENDEAEEGNEEAGRIEEDEAEILDLEPDPEEELSPEEPEKFPCEQCRTASGEPKMTEGEKFCGECGNARVAIAANERLKIRNL